MTVRRHSVGECEAGTVTDPGLQVIVRERRQLLNLAYRLLGSLADAEDVLQEAFIRWMGADRGLVREPEAFLRRTVARLCLDQLK